MSDGNWNLVWAGTGTRIFCVVLKPRRFPHRIRWGLQLHSTGVIVVLAWGRSLCWRNDCWGIWSCSHRVLGLLVLNWYPVVGVRAWAGYSISHSCLFVRFKFFGWAESNATLACYSDGIVLVTTRTWVNLLVVVSWSASILTHFATRRSVSDKIVNGVVLLRIRRTRSRLVRSLRRRTHTVGRGGISFFILVSSRSRN